MVEYWVQKLLLSGGATVGVLSCALIALGGSGGQAAVAAGTAGAAGCLAGMEIAASCSDELPAPLSSDARALGATQVSQVVQLAGAAAPGLTEVTLRYDTKKALGARPLVIAWDRALASYRPVVVKGGGDGTVTFVTSRHDTPFVAIAVTRLAGNPAQRPAP